MVYQEQIMRILNRLGGIDLSKSYACIKAISKKVQEKIDATRADFLAGCRERGVSQDVAEDIFEKIVFFAGYGFNKSHTAAYAQIGYQTAYLKAHYTAEYMAALLTSEIDDGNKRDVMVDHIADARRLGVDVLPPDINKSRPDFDVVDGQITFGLTAIKGVGHGAAEEIARVRDAGGRFTSLFDFCERVDPRVVTRAAVERLIKAGAMDVFGRRAAQVMALEAAFDAAAQRIADRKRGQRNFFDLLGGDAGANGPADADGAAGLPDVPEWPELEKLKFEKEALDFYVSSHPLAQFDDQLRRFRTHATADAMKARHGTEVRLGGMITALQVRTTKTGKRFAIFRLEDFTGQIKCVLWSEELQRFKDLVADDRIHLFEGVVEWGDRAEPDVIVKRVLTADDARKELTRGLLVRMAYADDDETLRKVDWLGKALARYRGSCPVYLSVRDPAGRAAQFKLGSDYWVNPATVPVDELEKVLGPGAVVFTR
jgi:DNA polymerase-3 subunit alpha